MRFFLLFTFLLYSSISIAQQSSYTKQWVAVDTLELKGQITAALNIVNDIRASSKNTNGNDFIKASILRWKFLQTTTENPENTILQEINKTIQESQPLEQSILYIVKGKLLNDYVYNTSSITDTPTNDLRTWDNLTLGDTILNSYQKALQPKEILLKTPAGDINSLLDAALVSRSLQPTVYDILAQEALDFYNNMRFEIIQPETSFIINNEAIFGSSEVFRAWGLKTTNTLSSKFNIVTLLQDIERVHKNDKDPTAYLFAQLKRLQYAHRYYAGESTDDLYENALITLSRKHKNLPINGLINYELAKFYQNRSPYQYNPNEDLERLTYNIKAENLCLDIIKRFPNNQAAAKATQLIKIINAASLSIETKAHTLPSQANRAFVTYRNIDSLRLRIFKLPTTVDYNFGSGHSYYPNSTALFSIATTKTSIKDSLIVLPKSNDHNPHTTEFLIPLLDTGHYLLYFTNDNPDAPLSYSFSTIEVSKFNIKKTEYDDKMIYHFYDRNTGQPIVNMPIYTTSDRPMLNTSGVTNTLGEYELKRVLYTEKDSISNRVITTAIRGKDTLIDINYIYRYYPYTDGEEKINAKTVIFLDRGIYRPGQTLYFKGILFQEKAGKTKVVPNEKVVLYIDDANNDEILEKEFKTNKYGSFSGEFKLPEDILTGEFSIYAEEGDDDSDFWDTIYDYEDDEKTFKVEAYKRPTFEITFDKVSEIYKPNDSITITGNAKAFLGSNITDASGSYAIKRYEHLGYEYYNSNYYSGRDIAEKDFKTDENGNFEITFKANFEYASLDDVFEFYIQVEITDINGETREGRTSVRVSSKSIITTLTAPEKLKSGEHIKLEVTNENLNGAPVFCDNKLKIFKIASHPKILYNRYWQAPEHQQITASEFIKNFPHEPYTSKAIDASHNKMMYEGLFKSQTKYQTNILIDASWEAGEYLIEQQAQDKNGVITITTASFNLIKPKNKYLPKDKVFDYEIVNENPKKDGYVELQLRTSLQKLPVYVNGFYDSKRFFAQKVDIDGNKTIKIPLQSFYKNRATIRIKYAQFDRFYTKDIKIDLSEPLEYLQVETSSFRSILYPDSKERWSFNIKDQQDEKVKAEVLAAMYDISLDNFAPSYWDSQFKIEDVRDPYIPNLTNQIDSVRKFNVRLDQLSILRHHIRYDKLNYFGFSFGNNYNINRQHLAKLKRQQQFFTANSKFTGNIRGILYDEDNEPLPGVTVTVQSSLITTQTNFNGEFSIEAKKGDVLEFSYTGYKTQEIIVTNSGSLFINLEYDYAGLDEVLVTGYKSTITKNITGAVASISAEALVGNNPNPTDLLQEKYVNTFKDVKIRKNLNETAFFFPHLTTNRKGELKFTFDAPELLTKWKFRLLAHSKKLSVGKIESEVITQKNVNIVPNTPRFLREGDTVSLSAKIANLTKEQLKGTAQLQLFDALTMQPIDIELSNTNATQDFIIDKYGNTSIFWEIKIPVGIQAVTYRMLAKAGQFSDGEENILPVLSSRMMTTETVPFLVRAGDDKTVKMNNLLTNSSTTLENHQFSLEYTANPSWYALQSLPYLMEFPHECAEQTFSRLYANSLSAKILNSNPKIKDIFIKWKGDGILKNPLEKNASLQNILISETPWLRNAQSKTQLQKRLGLLFDIEKNAASEKKTINKLIDLQNADGGFPWFSNGESNFYITRHIVAGTGHLKKLGITLETDLLLKKAIYYLDHTVENIHKKPIDNLYKNDFYRRISYLHFLYARSFFDKEYPLPDAVKQITNPILAYYNENWLNNSLYEKGLLALINHRIGSKEVANNILANLKEIAIQSEINGMYWENNPSGWYWYEAPIETQSLLIEAFDEISQDQKTIDELKIWLIQQKRSRDWRTTKATAEATYALLMSGSNFLDLDDNVSFEMPMQKAQEKINNAPREEGTGTMKVTWKKEKVTPDIAQVTIKNRGTSPGYGSLYWQYFEELDNIEASENQVLKLSKKIYLLDKQSPNEKLKEVTSNTVLALGQTVRVQLTINTQSNMEFVHLKDMRASGFEPIDVISKHTYQNGLRYYQTTRDVATHFFFDEIRQGTYVIEYDLRVNNRGTFSNGISTLQSIYAPEFSGNTSGTRVVIE